MEIIKPSYHRVAEPKLLCRIVTVSSDGDGGYQYEKRPYLKVNHTFSSDKTLMNLYLTAEQGQLIVDILNEETATLPVVYGMDFLI